MKPLPNLDFLRACAVLSVVAEHILLAYRVTRIGSWEIAWVGVIGVFIFFVHTSLVLMWSLERKPHTLDFYIRRVFRIYPLAIIVITIALLLHTPVSGSPGHFFGFTPPAGKSQLIGAFLLSPNLLGNYIPISVMWSLPYELQMYLVLPMLFFFLKQNFSQWPLTILWVFSVAVCRMIFPGVTHNFFLAIPYFLPGAMAYVGFSRRKASLPAWTFPLALVVFWSLFMLRPTWRMGDVLCLAVGLSLPIFRQITVPSILRTSHAIAKYSYGMYLTHPFAIVLGLYLMPHVPVWMQLTTILSSTAVLSIAAYHLIEHPLIRIGSKLATLAEARYEQRELAQYRSPVMFSKEVL